MENGESIIAAVSNTNAYPWTWHAFDTREPKEGMIRESRGSVTNHSFNIYRKGIETSKANRIPNPLQHWVIPETLKA